MEKICTSCRLPKSIDQFRIYSDGRARSHCKKCQNSKNTEYQRNRRQVDIVYRMRRYKQIRAIEKTKRKDPKYLAQTILKDSKESDRKHKREHDLTLEFIQSKINVNCTYCEESAIRMTLDRIDNNIGHLQNNVVAACIRCNYIRRNMPYDAWLCLLPGLKEARKLGLFKEWTGRCR